ncbi:NifB/NifX family molybdenum-iron cluster-binding protein [Aeromonas simiae]|nr:NifB/NifX family molybdenum-iron cluster-binding protein [Aeromonas simiae]
MLIATPTEALRLTPHCAKAPEFVLQDQSGRLLGQLANPAGDGCQGRRALPEQLIARGVTHLVVRRIGEKMLARMLAAGLVVLRAERGWQPGQGVSEQWERLSDASQGAPSRQQQQRNCTSHQGAAHECGGQDGECHAKTHCCASRAATPLIPLRRKVAP